MKHLSTEIAAGVATVTLDRPPVNAINAETLDEIISVFRGVGDDPEIRVVVFTAAGERAFIAGTDLRTVRQTAEGAPRPIDPGLRGRTALEAIGSCAVPVIAAVNGPVIGGGVAFVSMCDII